MVAVAIELLVSDDTWDNKRANERTNERTNERPSERANQRTNERAASSDQRDSSQEREDVPTAADCCRQAAFRKPMMRSILLDTRAVAIRSPPIIESHLSQRSVK